MTRPENTAAPLAVVETETGRQWSVRRTRKRVYVMQLKTASVTYERKLNTGNYSSATLGITLWADIDPTEDSDAAVVALQEKAREFVKHEYLRLSVQTSAVPIQPANGH